MAQAHLRRKARQEGQAESVLTSRNNEPTSGTMADLFAGRTGVVSGSSEAYSEDGGKRFAAYLAKKHKEAAGTQNRDE